MTLDLWKLYRLMLKARVFQEKIIELWNEGLISGEMHTGLGEEAIAAGSVDHLQEGDAMALDHRGSPPLVMRGVDMEALFHELMGDPQGICGGHGGHMHLFSRSLMAASSGIVGASGPLGSGFALAMQHLHPGKLAVAYFGEGALNQGMLLESLNLASCWKLPIIFICKDNSLAIATDSSTVTGGSIADRIRGFGIPFLEVDGLDVEVVWQAGFKASEHVRAGKGPYFIHARCAHLEGHFLGDPLLGVIRKTAEHVRERTGPLLKSVFGAKGPRLSRRVAGLTKISSLVAQAKKQTKKDFDPVEMTRNKLSTDQDRLMRLDEEVRIEIEQKLKAAMDRHDAGAGS